MLQGTIEGYEHSYALDDSHVFERDRPTLVCGNTAAVLGEGGLSHLAKHFQVGFHLYSWRINIQQREGRLVSDSSCHSNTGGAWLYRQTVCVLLADCWRPLTPLWSFPSRLSEAADRCGYQWAFCRPLRLILLACSAASRMVSDCTDSAASFLSMAYRHQAYYISLGS